MDIKSKCKVLPQGVIVKFNTDRNFRFSSIKTTGNWHRKFSLRLYIMKASFQNQHRQTKLTAVLEKRNDFDLFFHC